MSRSIAPPPHHHHHPVLTIRRTTPGSFASSSRDCTLQRRGSSLRLSRLARCCPGGGDVRSWSFLTTTRQAGDSISVEKKKQQRRRGWGGGGTAWTMEMVTGPCRWIVWPVSAQDSRCVCACVSAAAAPVRCANASSAGDAATHVARYVKRATADRRARKKGRAASKTPLATSYRDSVLFWKAPAGRRTLPVSDSTQVGSYDEVPVHAADMLLHNSGVAPASCDKIWIPTESSRLSAKCCFWWPAGSCTLCPI